VRSEAGKSQLNLPHGTKTKPGMQKKELYCTDEDSVA